MYLDYWKDYARRVQVPVMYGLAEAVEPFWKSGDKYVQDFAAVFEKSPRVKRGLMLEAPHYAELSYMFKGRYARVFGFSMECAIATAIGRLEIIG